MKKNYLLELSESGNTIRIYNEDSGLIYKSNQERLKPLLEYINEYSDKYIDIIVVDKIMGNAAALLSIKAGCKKVYSPLGSQIAVNTLNDYGIFYQISTVVPYITQPGSIVLCPMEKLSLNKTVDEFYDLVKANIL